jgi:hypothetical protein
MVDELRTNLSTAELAMLCRYANRLMRAAYLEQKLLQGHTETSLFNAFYWRQDLPFCMFWSLFTLLPKPVINLAKTIKRQLK